MAQQVGSAESQILRVAPDDPRLTWHGIVSLQPGNGWVAPWRLPYADRLLYPPELIRDAVAMPYGGRLAFRSTATTIEGRVDELQLSTINTPATQALVGKCLTEASTVDLFCDDRLVGSTPLVGKRTFTFDGLPAGDNRLELWLPQYAPFRLVELALNPGAELMQDDDERPRWIAMLARLIRDLRADYVSLEVALNALRSVSLSPRTYGSALIGFVQTIRDGHPEHPDRGAVAGVRAQPRRPRPEARGARRPHGRTCRAW